MKVAGIIVAGGRGQRLGGAPKQWRKISGRSLAHHAICALKAAGLDPIVLVHPANDDAEALAIPGVLLAAGGDTRSESVRAGLELLASDPPDAVLVHDAARPCVTPNLVSHIVAALEESEGAAPALPVTDALWHGHETVTGTQPREGLWRAQTPQGFRFAPFLASHRAYSGGATDDVEVARAAGITVVILPGEEDNIKVTHPGDLERATRILEACMDVRTGNGYDVHAFGPGDHVMLCGVKIPHSQGLMAHSDGDVGLHALTDAVLGALAQGDIGQHFPPSDPRWRGAASHQFLRHARSLAEEAGFRVTHADVTLVCEAPRIGRYAAAMKTAVADALGTTPDRISVKATTSEGLGFTGRREGIAALATATLVRP